MPISIRLDSGTEQRLDALARMTGRSRACYILEAIGAHIDDLDVIYLAEKRLEALRAGRNDTVSLEEVNRDLGLAD